MLTLAQARKEEEERRKKGVSDDTSYSNNEVKSLEQLRQEEHNKIQYDAEGWFQAANSLMNDVSSSSEKPDYNFANNALSYSERLHNLSDDNYIDNYVESLRGTSVYDNLKNQVNQYKQNLREFADYTNNLNAFASKFDNEDDYNRAMTELNRSRKYATLRTYDDFLRAAEQTDDEEEKQWLSQKGEEIATPTDVQNAIDKLKNSGEAEVVIRKNLFGTVEPAIPELERLESLKKEKESEEKYDKYYNNLDPEVKKILERYYYVEKNKDKNIGEENPDEAPVLPDDDEAAENIKKDFKKEKLEATSDFRRLSEQGYDIDELYKWYSRAKEHKEAEESLKEQADLITQNPGTAAIASLGSVITHPIAAANTASDYIKAEGDKLFNNGDGYIDPSLTSEKAIQNTRDAVSKSIDNPIGSFLYETGMSMGDFASLLPLNALPGGQTVSLAIMSTEAGTQAANEAIENGSTLEQALATGVASGIAEAFFEKMSIDQLKAFKQSGSSSVKDIVQNVFRGMATEGSEEAFTDFANLITDNIINGDVSQFSKNKENYLKAGYNDAEAELKAWQDFGIQVAQSAAGGALSGGVMNAGAAGMNYASNTVTGNDIKAKDNAEMLTRIAKQYQNEENVAKLAQKLKKDRDYSPSKLGQLRSEIMSAASEGFNNDKASAIENFVNNSSLSEEEKSVAFKFIKGESLSQNEADTINSSKSLRTLVSSMPEIDSKHSQNYIKALKSVDFTLPKAEMIEYNKVDTNGMTQQNALKANAKAQGFNADTTKSFVENYDGKEDVGRYTQEFLQYHNIGRTLSPMSSLDNNVYTLPDKAKLAAYESGKNVYIKNAKAQYTLTQAQEQWKSENKGYKEGTVDTSEIKNAKLSKYQKEQIEYISAFAKSGINIRFYESKPNTEGKFTDANGYYDSSSNTVAIDVNAGRTNINQAVKQAAMMSTFSHELTHVSEHAPEQYVSLRESIANTIGDGAWSEYVQKQVTNLKNHHSERYNSMSDDEVREYASKEALAEVCSDMLRHSDVLEKMAAENPSTAKKLIEVVKKVINRLRELHKKIFSSGIDQSIKGEARTLLAQADDLQSLVDKWEKAVTEGVKNQNARQAVKENTENSDSKFSIRNTINSDYTEQIKNYLSQQDNDVNSNYVQTQDRQIYLDNFKEWFGDWENDSENASKIVDEDGKPLVVYHGTDADFTVFDKTKGRSGMDIQGMFFSPWELDAGGYGSNVRAFYLNIKNPAPEGLAYKVLNKFAGENYAGIKAREELERMGYDGVNNGDEEYIAFYPEQIKSATDNIGTFDKNNPDIQYQSRNVEQIDRDYLTAVERGDLDTAQRMVDEAAKAAGYDLHLYHGSKSGGGFTVFKDWQYFTESKDYADRYTNRDSGTGLYDVYVKSSRMFDTRNRTERELFNKFRMEYGMGELQKNGLPDWTDGYDIAEIIEENNLDYDGIVLDEGGDLVNGKPVSRGESYVIRESNQIKSADAVTYDDNGEVIPLSERFKDSNQDIRYQDRGNGYSYDELVNKPDMKVTVVDDSISYTPNSTTRKSIVSKAEQNAASVGRYNENGNAVVYVEDIKNEIIVSRRGLRHGLDRRLQVLAPITLQSGELLKNAIRINETIPKNINASNTYVLISAAKNKKNEPYIVSFVVNRETNEVDSINILYSINAKKEPAGRLSPGVPAKADYLTGSTISISDLLDYVNKHFPDILPESVLKHYGYEERPEGVLNGDILYQDREEVKRMEPVQKEFELIQQDYLQKYYKEFAFTKASNVKEEKSLRKRKDDFWRERDNKLDELIRNRLNPKNDSEFDKYKDIFWRTINPKGRMPLEASIDISKWDVVNSSPYSASYYNSNNIGWSSKPEGSLRLSDHWNFKTDDYSGIHCKLKGIDGYQQNRWILAKYHNGEYEIIKEYPSREPRDTQYQDREEVYTEEDLLEESANGDFNLDVFDEDLVEDEGENIDFEKMLLDDSLGAMELMFNSLAKQSHEIVRSGKNQSLSDSRYRTIANKLVKEYSIERSHIGNLTDKIKNFVNTASDENFSDSFKNFVLDMRQSLLYSNVLDDERNQRRKDVRDIVKGRTLIIPEAEEGEIRSNYENIRTYKNKLLGYGITVALEKNAQTGIDGSKKGTTVKDIITDLQQIGELTSLGDDIDGGNAYVALEELLSDTLAPKYINPYLDGMLENIDVAAVELAADVMTEYARQQGLNATDGLSPKEINKLKRQLSKTQEQRDNLLRATKANAKLENELRLYKKRLDKLREDSERLDEINWLIESNYDDEDLLKRRTEIEKLVDDDSKELLKLKSTKPIKNLVDRKVRQAVAKERKKQRNVINQLNEQKKNSRIQKQEWREARELTEVVDKIRKLQSKMSSALRHPTANVYVPDAFATAYIEACTAITEALENGKMTKANINLKTLLIELDKLNKSDTEYNGEISEQLIDSLEYVIQLVGLLDQQLKELDGKPINTKNLTLKQANNIYTVLYDIYNTVQDATKQLDRADVATNYESGEALNRDFNEAEKFAKKAKLKGFKNLALNGIRLARYYSGYNDDSEIMYHVNALNEGQRKANIYKMNAEKKFLELTEKRAKEYKHSLENIIDVDYQENNGNTQTISLTRMTALQILMTWSREQSSVNLVHMEKSGFLLPNAKLLKKGKIAEAIDKSTRIEGVNTSLITALESKLTDFEQEYRKIAEEYFNDYSKKAINEVSNKIKHRSVAMAEYYIPIVVDKNYLQNELEELNFDRTLEGMGMLKSTVRKAPQPLVITSLNTVIARHINDVSKLYGLAVPTRNFKKALNVNFRNEDGGKSGSVRDTITKVWGSNTNKFFNRLIADLESSRVTDNDASNRINKTITGLRKAMVLKTLTANISVVIKQAASYPTAGVYLSHSALMKGLAVSPALFKPGNYQKLIDEIDAHTAQHYMRRIGMSQQELAEMMNSWARKIPTVLNPAKWIQGVDCITTALLWNSCKYEVKRSGKAESSEGFFDEVAKLYDKVIEDTQPMYDTLHRTELQKTTHEFWKSIFMFKTQPLQNTGIIYDSIGDALAHKGDKKRKNKSKVIKAITSQIISLSVFAGMSYLAAMALNKKKRYKDDDDEVTLQSVLSTVFGDMLTNGVGVVEPFFGNELYEYISAKIKGDNPWAMFSVPVVDMLNDTFSAAGDTYDEIIHIADAAQYGVVNPESIFTAVNNFGVQLSGLFGVPTQNVENILNGILSRFEVDLFNKPVERKPQSYAESYGRHYAAGESKKAKEQLDKLYQKKYEEQKSKGEYDVDAYKNARKAVRDALSNAFKEEYQRAYLRDDREKQQEISNLLQHSGYMVYENGRMLSDVLFDWRKNAKDNIGKKYK